MVSKVIWFGAAAAAVLVVAQSAGAEVVQPQPAPMPPPIAAPQDIPYPGVLKLSVDATDLAHAIMTMHETVPVSGPGPSSCSCPSGCQAPTRRAAPSTSWPG